MLASLCLMAWNEPDLHPELLALLDIGVHDVEDGLAGPHHLGRQRHRGLLDHSAQDRSGRAGLAQHAVALDADRVQRRRWRSCGWRRGRPWARCRTAPGGTTNRPMPSSPALPGQTGRHHHLVGDIGVEDEMLLAVEHEALPVGDARASRCPPPRSARRPRPPPGSPRCRRWPPRRGTGGAARAPRAPAGPGRTGWRWPGTVPGTAPARAARTPRRARRSRARGHRPPRGRPAPGQSSSTIRLHRSSACLCSSTTLRTSDMGHSRSSTARTASCSAAWSSESSSSTD